MNIDLDPVDRITADAVGPAGQRTFFIQARKDEHLVTVLVEKQQVQLLAASVVEILAGVDQETGRETGEGPPEEAMGLEEPLLPEWRAGKLSIGYREDRDLVVLEVEELLPQTDDDEDEDEDEGDDEGGDEDEREGGVAGIDDDLAATVGDPDEPAEPSRVRLWATREQMLAFARHGAEVCGRGRPTCPYCDQPMDVEGHVCPKMNGHRTFDGA